MERKRKGTGKKKGQKDEKRKGNHNQRTETGKWEKNSKTKGNERKVTERKRDRK